MSSFQEEFRYSFHELGVEYSDNTKSMKLLDFTLLKDGVPIFHIDVKEKRQNYNAANWPLEIPEPYTFILDDLSARKVLAFAPKSGIAVRDIKHGYIFFPIIDLYLMPKKRVNRRIERKKPMLKGKWILDLRNGHKCQSPEQIIDEIKNYLSNLREILFEQLECYGDYLGERLGVGGIKRMPKHWNTDVEATK